MSFKVAFIGAGSIGFTRGLLTDLLSVPEFHDIEVAFTDINPDNLRMVTQLCQRDIDPGQHCVGVGVIEQDASGSRHLPDIFTEGKQCGNTALPVHDAADAEGIAHAI